MEYQEKLVGTLNKEYTFRDLSLFVRKEYDKKAFCIPRTPLERAKVAFRVGHGLYVVEHETKVISNKEITTKIFFTAASKNTSIIEDFVRKIGPFKEVVLEQVS